MPLMGGDEEELAGYGGFGGRREGRRYTWG